MNEGNACGLFRDHVMTTDEWKAKHQPHHVGEFKTKPFAEGYPDWPHQDWKYLVCDCGARQLTTGKDGER